MSKFYKIIILLSSIAIIFAFSNMALAQKGYFLEKGNEFFVFDNLFINGYFTVGTGLRDKTGRFGDLLIGGNFSLADDSKFIFCRDEMDPQTNLPVNRDCTKKVLVWHPDLLEVVAPDFYQISANSIIAGNNFIFQAEQPISTNYTARVYAYNLVGGNYQAAHGCLVNDGTEECTDFSVSQLKTSKMYLESFSGLTDRDIAVYGNNLHFKNIDVSQEGNIDVQNVCWKQTAASCPGTSRGQANYKNPNFCVGGTCYPLDPRQGPQLCCYLIIDNF